MVPASRPTMFPSLQSQRWEKVGTTITTRFLDQHDMVFTRARWIWAIASSRSWSSSDWRGTCSFRHGCRHAQALHPFGPALNRSLRQDRLLCRARTKQHPSERAPSGRDASSIHRAPNVSDPGRPASRDRPRAATFPPSLAGVYHSSQGTGRSSTSSTPRITADALPLVHLSGAEWTVGDTMLVPATPPSKPCRHEIALRSS